MQIISIGRKEDAGEELFYFLALDFITKIFIIF